MNETKLILRLSAEGGQVVVREISDVTEAAKQVNSELHKTGPAGTAAKSGMDEAANSSTALNSHMRTLLQSVSVLAGGLGAMALIDRADEWGQYASRIRQATKSTAEYDYVQSRMVASANATFRSIKETRDSFISMSPILRDMGYQLNQSIDIVDSFSSLLVTNAASADKAQSAQDALSKSIQSGRVEADAWQTIFGVMPSILDNLTKATGKSGTEIRQLGVNGKLSLTDLTNALLTSYEANRKAVEGMPTTVRDALTNLNTVFSDYIGWQNEATGATAFMADGLGLLSDNFGTVANIAGGVAAAALVNYTATLGAAGIARIQKMNADMAGLAVDAQAAAGADRVAQAEKLAALAALDRAKASVTRAEAEVAASKRIQAEDLSRLKTMQESLAAERSIEIQRQKAQISATGRQQSTARLAELQVAHLAISKQVEASEKSLAMTTATTSTTVQAAYSKRAQAAAVAAAATKAANATAIASENAAAAASRVAAAGRGLLTALGGPAGLAITVGLAATAMLSFGSSNEEVTRSLQEMQQPLDDIKKKFAEMNADQQAAQKVKWAEAHALAIDEVKVAYRDLEKVMAVGFVYGDLNKAKELENELKAAADAGSELAPILSKAGKYAGVPQSKIDEWIKLAGVYGDAKTKAAAAASVIESVNKAAQETNTPLKPLPVGENNALATALLSVYNAQMLNATAIDATGKAMTGIDFELFKAGFKEVTKLPTDAEAAIRSFYKTAEAGAQMAASDKYLTSLKEEVRLQQIRQKLGEQEYELAKLVSSQKITDPKQLATLKQQLALQQQISQVKAEDDALKALKRENDLMQIRLDKGEAEYELQKLIRELKVNDPAMIALLDLEIDRQRQLNEQLDVRKYLTDGTYDDVLDGLTKMGDVGSAAGNAIVDAFGSVADQFTNMAEQQDEFTKKFITLSEARKKADKETDPARRAKALEKADSVERGLQEDQLRMQMGNYSTLTGAASKMFSENSKGRQVLHRMETTFAAIETALALKKAAANALTAITNQGGGDPYSAFIRIGAMMALMAGLGVFSGSSSASGTSTTSRQESQGTGTVLGDSSAKSESIANSLDRIESLELDQYTELRSINTSIRALNAGIAKLAVNLVASYGKFDESSYQGSLGKDYKLQLGDTASTLLAGGVIGAAVDKMLGGLLSGITNKILGGLFGSTKKELVDSGISFAAQELGDILATGLVDATLYDTIKTTKKKLFGLSKKTSEKTEYRSLDEEVRAEFGRVFSYIGTSVIDAVSMLGLATSKSLEDFVIKLPNVSFKDLSGDEIEKELQAIFSQQGDLMAKYLVPGIAEFQQMGEGLYDTLIRVAQEQAVFNAGLASLGLELSRFGNVAAATQIEIAQSLIELMGGIDEFSSATSDYFSTFYSESEQMAYMQKVINDQFKSLNIALPSSREGFKNMVDGLDLTTDAGQAMFAALMKLVPMMDEFYDAAEEHSKDLAKWTQSIRSELASLDMTPFERSLAELTAWYDAQIAEAAEFGADTTLLERLYARKRADLIATELDAINKNTAQSLQTLTSEHDRAVNELKSTYKQLTDSISAASNSIGAAILDIKRQIAGWDEIGYQQQQVGSLNDQLGQGDLASQIKTIEQLQAAVMGRYQAELAQNSSLIQQAQSKLDSLNSSFAELQSALKSVQESIASSILDLRRQGSSWNEVGYQNSLIGNLRSQLGTGSVLDQINNVGQLQQAIVDRYNAELAANQQLSSAAQERYDADLSAYNALKDAAKQLSSAADALLLSDLSPAKMGDQFAEAQKQFNDLLRKARGGDADAAKQLESVGSTYLELAQDYLASGSTEYAAIFNQVQSAYRSFGNSIGGAPSVPREVLDYQKADVELQAAAIKELEQLQLLLSGLDKTAKAEQLVAETAAKAELAQYQEQLLALQTGTVTELQSLQTLLAELDAQARREQTLQLDKLTATFETAKNELLAAAEKQISAINALTGGMQSIAAAIAAMPAPVVVVTPMPPVVIPPVVVQPMTIPTPAIAPINASEPMEHPILERTNELLQQQLKQSAAAQARAEQQSRQLQAELQRTQQMLHESRRLMA